MNRKKELLTAAVGVNPPASMEDIPDLLRADPDIAGGLMRALDEEASEMIADFDASFVASVNEMCAQGVLEPNVAGEVRVDPARDEVSVIGCPVQPTRLEQFMRRALIIDGRTYIPVEVEDEHVCRDCALHGFCEEHELLHGCEALLEPKEHWEELK